MTNRRGMLTITGAFVVAAAVAVVAPHLASCTDASLERIPAEQQFRDDKLAVEGALCTSSPEKKTYPLRVIFVVDCSESMAVTDPPDPVSGVTGRERAVRETWTQLLAQGGAGVRVGIIRFSSQAQPLTPVDTNGDGLPDSYYTDNAVQLDVATQQLRTTDRTTNYINALGEAYFEMRTDLLAASKESLPLSKYVVVFVSDGLPDVDTNTDHRNTTDNILGSVRALKELAGLFRVGNFSFHTAYLSLPASMDTDAESLLKQMAVNGGGTYRNFTGGESLNFFHIDFTVMQRIFTLKSVVVVNTNVVMDRKQVPVDGGVAADAGPPHDAGADGGDASIPDVSGAYVDENRDKRPECGEPLVDSDGDGLADIVEVSIGTDPLDPDTDGDGLSDRLEWEMRSSGLDPLNPNDARCYVPALCIDNDADGFCDCVKDSDNDGVCDCVHDAAHPCMDDKGHDCIDEDHDGFCDCRKDERGRCVYPDTDGDGLNDCEEVYYGTDPHSVDTDSDGIPDSVEVRFGSNPVSNDTLGDPDHDQTLTGTEVRTGTAPLCDDTEFRLGVAYRYAVVETGTFGSTTCYAFSIDNITLVPTLKNPKARYPGNGWNRILVYAGEVSFDDPSATASYRVACVMANYEPNGNYKEPPSGRVKLTEEDFKEVKRFDPKNDCRWP